MAVNRERLEENTSSYHGIGTANNSYNKQKNFKKFQLNYLMVYLTVMGVDWLQGPYLYILYTTYGLTLEQITLLFIIGFVTGATAGTILGSLADLWGRRKVSLLFCATTISALCLRLAPIFPILVVSHIFSGASTTLMYSVFESWYISEHAHRGYPADWRTRTFVNGTFLNGLVAIVASLVANQLVGLWGVRAPYVFSTVLLGSAGLVILTTWTENYGEAPGNGTAKLVDALKQGFQVLYNDSSILLLGVSQTIFECSMYIFVLVYTPAMENAASNYFGYDKGQQIPLSHLFYTMMFAVMCGSLFFQAVDRQASSPNAHRIVRGTSKDRLLSLALAIACVAFCLMVFGMTSMIILGLAYHAFEFATGLYYPSISELKAQKIPEESRASVMALLRAPINIFSVVIFLTVSTVNTALIFGLCGAMTILGAMLVVGQYKN